MSSRLDYDRFVGCLDLDEVCLTQLVGTRRKPTQGARSLSLVTKGSEKAKEVSTEGFQVEAQVIIEISEICLDDKTEVLCTVECTHVLTYRLSLPDDAIVSPAELSELAQHYASRNAVFNTWPYARELMHSMTLRMGLPPVVLPLRLLQR